MAEPFDVLVIGAGPAGMAAAGAAARRCARVGIVDAGARMGGQVWRHDVGHAPPAGARRLLSALHGNARIEWMAQATVAAVAGRRLLVEDPRGAKWLESRALVLATGARELMLPFPGWTLPGVTGAGGLQALAKQGWPLGGQRLVVAGAGPLLLAAAATARRHGARVLAIHEQAGRTAMLRFTRGLWRWPPKALQAAALRARLVGVPYAWKSVVVAAHGDERLREVEIDGPRGRSRLACDLLAVGYGLVPEVRLAQMLGCRLERDGAHARVWVDGEQRTSVAGVFAAGEACGIGGRDCALAEGAIAGLAATGAAVAVDGLYARRRRARDFAATLRATFALDARVRALAEPDTVVCRCEDVPLKALEGFGDARAAKLATRCGMGPCQGRICGSALAELGRLQPRADDPRPPLWPVRLASLVDAGP